jgi:hypothetical protein
MVVQFHLVLGTDVPVQFLDRVLVLVYRLLAWGVDVVVRVLMRMRVLVGVDMHHAIRVPVLVGMDVRVDVGMWVLVLDLTYHRVFLLQSGSGNGGHSRQPWLATWPSGRCLGRTEILRRGVGKAIGRPARCCKPAADRQLEPVPMFPGQDFRLETIDSSDSV